MIQRNRIVLKNIGNILGMDKQPYSFKKGKAMSIIESFSNAYLVIEDGIVAEIGSMADFVPCDDMVIDVQNGIVCPTWVDSHTHIVFAASRHEEYVQRLEGATYEEIAEQGGGILNSAKKLASTSHQDLYNSAKLRLDSMIGMGTGAVEIKSGYGLSFESEIKMLEVIKQLKQTTDAHITSTFLGAHAVPAEYKQHRADYIQILTEKMLPYIAEHSLADYCDVFCDKGFFTVEETRTILMRAAEFGIKGKIHANELAISGGVQIGIEMGAVSVDHLECTSPAEWEALKHSNTIPTLLPGTSFFLGIPYAEARAMIDYGLGIVLASDFNPGSTPSGNMHLLQALATNNMKMLPSETFNACTYNAAAALELQTTHGVIGINKPANLQVMSGIQSVEQIPYFYGQHSTTMTILNGKIQ